MDDNVYLKELKSLIDSDNNSTILTYSFTILELRNYIDIINLKASNELKLKLQENNSYLTLIDFTLVFNEKKIIKKFFIYLLIYGLSKSL